MLKENRSETDDLHRTIAAKDAELLTERNVKMNFFYFVNDFLLLQQRAKVEEQLRQQTEDQKRLEQIQSMDSSNKIQSDDKFNQLREEYLTVLHRV
jgi:hypothetical protein